MLPSSLEPVEMMFNAVVGKRVCQREFLSIQRIAHCLRTNLILGTALAQPQDTSIKLQVMVRAQNEHVTRLIGTVVWFSESFDMGCFRIKVIFTYFQADSAELTGILVVQLQCGGFSSIAFLYFLFNRMSLYYSVRLLLLQPCEARFFRHLWHRCRRGKKLRATVPLLPL